MDKTHIQFTEQWMKSRHVVNGFIRGMIHDEHAAEDVLQSVAMTAASNFDEFDVSRPFGAWLIGIARRQVALYYRQQGKDKLFFTDALAEQIAQAHVELSPELEDRKAALYTCLNKLNDRGREIVRLRYSEDLKPARIAERVGTSSTAITSLLHRLRTNLRVCLEKRLKRERGKA